jgi:hypothetical protein
VSAAYFSPTYAEARRRFIEAASAAGARLHCYALGGTSPGALSVDVALIGPDHAPALLVSSGIHGVEGFFGSAVQLALLERLAAARKPHILRYVLLHGLNPFGFAHLRRANEDNVDLNRNFMPAGSPYAGAPAGYTDLDGFLNPPSAPPRFEFFRLKALGYIRRYGLQTLKDAVAGGQYEYPCGLFFGGCGPSASTRIVHDHCDTWLAASPHIVHIDLHTGLGAFARPTLLLNEAADSAHSAWYAQTFGADRVEPLAQSGGTAYPVSGMFGLWMQRHFSARDYRFVGAEFGTYDEIRVLAALRAENRAHHHSTPGDAAYVRAKKELKECFCPASRAWRGQVVAAALRIADQGAVALRARM